MSLVGASPGDRGDHRIIEVYGKAIIKDLLEAGLGRGNSIGSQPGLIKGPEVRNGQVDGHVGGLLFSNKLGKTPESRVILP